MFKISARSVLELGSELISTDIIAFYELIKNGFDAGTKNGVEIKFNVILRKNSFISLKKLADQENLSHSVFSEAIDQALITSNQSLLIEARDIISKASTLSDLQSALYAIYQLSTIVISDTGSGMSQRDLTNNFLVIGTASRKREVDEAILNGATNTPYLGEKGIGRLSAMRLGDYLRVQTARADDPQLNILEIDWDKFSNIDAMLDDIHLEPTLGGEKKTESWSGTDIVVGSLSEDWTHDRVKRMAEYDFARLTDPFIDQKNRPRIALFWNDERVDIPWMKQDLLNHAHARVTGKYEIIAGEPQLSCLVEAIDLGFEHPYESERSVLSAFDLESTIIGTTQEIPQQALYSVGPFEFEAHWYNRRRLTAVDGIGDLRAVRDLQEKWSGIMLFRDGFRVFPYGDDEDDWLALDRKALRRSGYLLNKDQFVGRVRISRTSNKDLLDQTNREGLRETPEQQVFLEVMKFVIQDRLFQFLRSVERQYKGQKVDLDNPKTQVIGLEKRFNLAISQLRKKLDDEDELKQTVEELQQVFYSFSDFSERSRLRIEEVEVENRQMVEMAGLGMMVEVVAHELARISENALDNLNALRAKNISDEVKIRLESLRSQMKSLSKRIRVLDPLSISGRQRKENFALQDLIQDTIEAHEGQFSRHNIHIKVNADTAPIKVRAVKGMLVQILENLISNSKYWMEMRRQHSHSYTPLISISLYSSPPTIVYEDNGYGIAAENKDRIFQPFFSLKEKKMRRGLGLFIAKECAQHNEGSLVLDDYINPETGRMHRFIIELPENSVA